MGQRNPFSYNPNQTSVLSPADKARLDKLWAEYQRTVYKIGNRYGLDLQIDVDFPSPGTNLVQGDVITLRYTVANTGNNILQNISLQNQTETIDTLAAGTARVNMWSETYTVTEQDIINGYIVATRTATSLTYESQSGRRAICDAQSVVITNLESPTIYFYQRGDNTETNVSTIINDTVVQGDPAIIGNTLYNPLTQQDVEDYLNANYNLVSFDSSNYTAQVEDAVNLTNIEGCFDKTTVLSNRSGINSMTPVPRETIVVPTGIPNGNGTTNYSLTINDDPVNHSDTAGVYRLFLENCPDDITFTVTADNKLEIVNPTAFNRTVAFTVTHDLTAFVNGFTSANLGNLTADTDLYTTNFKISNVQNGSQLTLNNGNLPGNYVQANPNTDQWTDTLAANIPPEATQYLYNSLGLGGPFTYNGRFNSLLTPLQLADWGGTLTIAPNESIIVYPDSQRRITTSLTYLCSGTEFVEGIDEFGNTVTAP